MNNKQASHLRPGMTIRHKVLHADRAIATATGYETFTVERVVRPTRQNDDVIVHAGGQAFKPWEIERVRYPDNEQTP